MPVVVTVAPTAVLPDAADQLRIWVDRNFDGHRETAASSLGITAAFLSYLINRERLPGRALARRLEDAGIVQMRAWPLSLPHKTKTGRRSAGRKRY